MALVINASHHHRGHSTEQKSSTSPLHPMKSNRSINLHINLQVQRPDDIIIHQRLVDDGDAGLGLAALLLLQLGDMGQQQPVGRLWRPRAPTTISVIIRRCARAAVIGAAALSCSLLAVDAGAGAVALVDVVHKLHARPHPPAVITVVDRLAALEAHLDLAGAGALLELGLAHGLGVAPPVLGVEQRELLLLRQALVLGLLILARRVQGRPEGQPGDLEVVELVLEPGGGLVVPAGARQLELLGEAVALDAAVLGMQRVLALELLGQLLVCPGALDEPVDVVDLVDQLGLGGY